MTEQRPKGHPIVSALIFIYLFLGAFGLLYLYSEIKSEGVQCSKNPSGYFYTNIQKNNPEALIMCSCSISKAGTSVRLSFNENGSYWDQNDNVRMEGLNISIEK